MGTTQASFITSADFTFAFGATGDGATVWTTTENADNSPTTQGNFTLTANPTSSSHFTTSGCSFLGRALQDNGGVCANPRDTAFGVPVTATYNGPAPANADPTNPNYQLTVEVTKISTWIGDYDFGSADGKAQWVETTSGHEQTSSLIDIPRLASEQLASAYVPMQWNPTDYAVALTGPNDSVTRTFGIPLRGDTDYRYFDGIEVFGRVQLSYSAVPEPSTLTLLLAGSVGLTAYALRRRK
jgi:hypothetical protein